MRVSTTELDLMHVNMDHVVYVATIDGDQRVMKLSGEKGWYHIDDDSYGRLAWALDESAHGRSPYAMQSECFLPPTGHVGQPTLREEVDRA